MWPTLHIETLAYNLGQKDGAHLEVLDSERYYLASRGAVGLALLGRDWRWPPGVRKDCQSGVAVAVRLEGPQLLRRGGHKARSEARTGAWELLRRGEAPTP